MESVSPEAVATEQDVINCYRMFLGREPEGSGAVQNMLATGLPLWGLVKAFMDSKEAAVRRATNAGVHVAQVRSENRIELDGAPGQIEQLIRNVQQVWASFGSNEPYWSVLVSPAFLTAAMNAQSEEVFYQSGRGDCDNFAAVCARNGINMPKDGLVVDFGCGVGRLGEHLSYDFKEYLGVDISSPHLAIASNRMKKIGRTNCNFQLLPDFIASSSTFDAFMSIIVLQHNPPPVIAMLLNMLLSRLRPGGVGLFQIPWFLFNYEFKLQEYLDSIDARKSMEMHALPQRAVFRAIADHSCRLIDVTLDGLIGADGFSYTYLVEKP